MGINGMPTEELMIVPQTLCNQKCSDLIKGEMVVRPLILLYTNSNC